MLQRLLPPALFAALALLLCRTALAPDRLLGTWSGESWGRAFVTHQITRWLQGEAAIGRADLLYWPEGSRFWPIDPALQLIQIPGELLGAGSGLVLAAAVVLFLNGWATFRLARRLGADALPATTAGLLVALSPYLLRNLQDAVVEPSAVGMGALAAEAMVLAVPSPTPLHLLLTFGGVLLLGLTSPYLAVYLALGCALAAPLTLRRWWRGWLGVAGVSALACLLALAPLRWAESGAHGRFQSVPSAAATQGGSEPGYSLDPGPLVQLRSDGTAIPIPRRRPPPSPTGSDTTAAEPPPHPEALSPLVRLARGTPGGAALLLATGLGLLLSGGRRWTALGAAIFLLGPGPPMLMRAFHIRGDQSLFNPLQRLLHHLPLTSSLGNPTRILTLWIVLAAVGVALSLSRASWRRGLAVALGLLAVLEAQAVLPGFALPSTRLPVAARSPEILAALQGPSTVFPSGDFPLFHPDVAPKEALLIAGLAEVPVPGDYGRWRVPHDLMLQRQLSAAAQTVHSVRATEVALPDGASTTRLESLLLLEDRLPPEGVAGVRSWLEAHGAQEVARAEEGASVWRLSGASY